MKRKINKRDNNGDEKKRIYTHLVSANEVKTNLKEMKKEKVLKLYSNGRTTFENCSFVFVCCHKVIIQNKDPKEFSNGKFVITVVRLEKFHENRSC